MGASKCLSKAVQKASEKIFAVSGNSAALGCSLETPYGKSGPASSVFKRGKMCAIIYKCVISLGLHFCFIIAETCDAITFVLLLMPFCFCNSSRPTEKHQVDLLPCEASNKVLTNNHFP